MYNKNIRSKWNFRYLDVGKGKKIMFFIYEKNEYHVNVKDEFAKATSGDYIDMLDAFGIVLHSLSDNPEFGNSTVMLCIIMEELPLKLLMQRKMIVKSLIQHTHRRNIEK